MLRKVLAVLLAATLLVCSGCEGAGTEVVPPQELLDLTEKINMERAEGCADGWNEEEIAQFQTYCTSMDGSDLDWDTLCVKPQGITGFLSYEEACRDVRVLVEALRAAYGGYAYFGGDAVFASVEADICASAALALREDGKIPRKQLAQIIQDYLCEVIQDGHFAVNKESLNQEGVQTYYVPELLLDSPDAISGVPGELVRRTVSPEGEVAYGLFALSRTGEDLPADATVNGLAVPLNWVRQEPYGTSASICDISEVSRIPIVGLSSFAPSNRKEERALNAFAAGGARYQGKPITILDLRGNGGGNERYPRIWLTNYLGSEAMPKQIWATRYTDFLLTSFEQAVVNEDDVQGVRENIGTCTVSNSARVISENDGILFVLVDHRTASAAEGFLWMLRSVENTVVVGTNTAGCIGFGNIGTIFLPHSGVPVRFGATISFHEGLENVEGRGILPDLWVPPESALEAVLALCGVVQTG